LPRWLIAAASVAIVVHLFAVGAVVLAARSGPWWAPSLGGPSPAEPPVFAAAVSDLTTPNYLMPLKLADNGHYMSNRPELPGVKLEAVLKFANGKEETLTFPDQNANPWVRHRQALLVRALSEDRPVMLDPSSSVNLVRGEAVRKMIEYWEAEAGPPQDKYRTLRLKTEAKDLVPRNREVFRPSEWSLLLARSYARYLCRTYGADKVVLIRYTQEAITPVELFRDRGAEPFPVLKAIFGEFSK
jgi:hypothetical protein